MKLDLRGGSAYSIARDLIQKFNLDVSHFTGYAWGRGLTKETDSRIANSAIKSGNTLRGKYHRPHTKATRQKMSKSASDRSWRNGLVKTKWWDVFCPHLEKIVKVQGTWELKYAKWLNKLGILWVKDRKSAILWQKSPDDIVRHYHPDFVLVDSNEHIEIKGFMWKDETRGVDDALKLRLVQEQNPMLKLSILMKDELVSMGVLI